MSWVGISNFNVTFNKEWEHPGGVPKEILGVQNRIPVSLMVRVYSWGDYYIPQVTWGLFHKPMETWHILGDRLIPLAPVS